FSILISELKKRGYLAVLRKSNSSVTLSVFKVQPQKDGNLYLLRVLLLPVAILTIIIDGWFRSQFLYPLGSIRIVITDTAIYGILLLGILGSHMLGHYISNRFWGVKTNLPYFIPGVPMVFPTLGHIDFLHERYTNWNSQFDSSVVGALFCLLASTVALFVGIFDTRVMTTEMASSLFGSTIHNVQLPIGVVYLLNHFFPAGPGQVQLLSPLLSAASFGFLISFLNIIPLWNFDGERAAAPLLNPRYRFSITWIAVLAFLLMQYYWLAFAVLVFSWNVRDVRPLDEVSPISPKRKIILFIVLAVAVITFYLFLYPPYIS
ncbi:MAG: hypothetical protein QXV84_06395, partial [Conexivisphaerales archaeon]